MGEVVALWKACEGCGQPVTPANDCSWEFDWEPHADGSPTIYCHACSVRIWEDPATDHNNFAAAPDRIF